MSAAIFRQFRHLHGRHPSSWPWLPRMLCALLMLLAALTVGWHLMLQPQSEKISLARQQEQALRHEFARNAGRARDLDRSRLRHRQVQAQVAALERQLPGRAELGELLAEINQAGLARGLQVELFKPGKEHVFDHYAELPIDIKLSGGFHAFAGFASDLANLSRIVMLDRLAIGQGRDGVLSVEGVARTFRYLDAEEQAARAKARAAAEDVRRNEAGR